MSYHKQLGMSQCARKMASYDDCKNSCSGGKGTHMQNVPHSAVGAISSNEQVIAEFADMLAIVPCEAGMLTLEVNAVQAVIKVISDLSWVCLVCRSNQVDGQLEPMHDVLPGLGEPHGDPPRERDHPIKRGLLEEFGLQPRPLQCMQ